MCKLLQTDSWCTIRQNLRVVKSSAGILLCAILFGLVEFLLWGRAHWEDGLLLLALLLLASFDQFKIKLSHNITLHARLYSWGILLIAGGLMLLASCHSSEDGSHELGRALCKNGAFFLLALAISMRFDGVKTALSFLPLYLLSIVILPLYEYLLLEISYPMRLVSTAAACYLLRICAVTVSFEGTTLFWNDQAISITDACSGISLLSFMFFLEYLIARKIQAPSWKKWCWSSMVLIWIILANALRQLLTFLLFTVMGEKVHEQTPHFLLGCFFIVAASLLIWFSSFLFQMDSPKQDAA
ncbi:MAG: exosortase/archaeosortase family protein [Victivallales bacterium]|nr:exosortase/archaeosortase family protein [Victivallales bacterium]